MRSMGALLCLCGVQAQAAPDNGFGFYVGALSSQDSSLYGNSNGGFLQADVQFMVDEHWSLNPYLLLGSETTDKSFDIETGEGGLQARYWAGNSVFLGGQFLFHDTLLKQGGTVSSSIYGPGIGLTVGWESDSHWSVSMAANAYRIWSAYGQPATTRSEALLLIGYHWY
ncbi:MAG TPA: hypothetical protein VGM16_07685 [Gammaproteobacteria bacterium]